MFLIFCIVQLWAASLAGVQLPNSVQLAEQPLILNGIGLREKFWVDVYVAGLYLPQKNTDAEAIIQADIPKKISLEFIYHTVAKEKMKATLEENLKNNPQIAQTVRPKMEKTYGWYQDFHTKDTLSFEYIPKVGTTIYINKQKKGTIEGHDFMVAIFTIYLGKKPASAQLKKQLLGL